MSIQQVNEMRVFIPITKVDVAKRMVYGTLAAEVPDKSGEIMDYDTAKVAIQAWSDAQSEASGGKSLGNVREMHSNIAAGKLTDIVFDDENKRVEGASKVVDDSTWKKIQEGVLTGFSIGGGYKKRWNDSANPQLKRYTPSVSEFSYVDNPCQPGATFEVVKSDGTTELRKFNQPSAQEAQSSMTNNANLEVQEPEKLWKATDGSMHKSKRDALNRNAELLVNGVTAKADDALAKLDDGIAAKEEGAEVKPQEEVVVAPVVAAETSVSIEDGAGATAAEDAGQEAASSGEVEKAAGTEGDLKKGLYEVSRGADLLQSMSYLQACVERNSKDSVLPENLKLALTAVGEWLKSYVTEQVDMLFPMEDGEIMMMAAKGAPVGELAKFVKNDADLCKASGAPEFVERLEKAANKTDKAHLEAMAAHHDTMQKCMDGMAKCMKGLGMGDDADAGDAAQKMTKAAGLTDEQLTKLAAFDGLQKKFDEIAPKLDELTVRLAKVESTPAETKGIMNTALVTKDGNNGENASGGNPVEAELNKMIAGGASPEQTSLAIMKLSLRQPVVVA